MIFDCLPGNGVILGNVLSYVDFVIMPITCDRFGVQGLREFKEVLGSYSKRINPDVKILGVLIIKYKGRQKLTRDLEDNLIPSIIAELDTIIFETKIPESVKCQESQVLRRSLGDYAPYCKTQLGYEALTDEILKELKKYEK